MPQRMTQRESDIARDLVPEIQSRLEFLEEVGLGYLTLDRGAPTLSGGEAQRIRLAAQLGSNLQGVCYVLDEPTIGLHARDNQILLNALHKLGDKGNTLVVVEHDEDTIRRADHIIDIGPSAGKRGGRLVAQGSVADITGAEDSQTGRYLLHAMKHPLQLRRSMAPGEVSAEATAAFAQAEAAAPTGRQSAAVKKRAAQAASLAADALNEAKERAAMRWLTVYGAQLHNLQNVTATVPLHRLVAVTGVSGSGKSTLARDVLLANVQAWVQQRSYQAPGAMPWTRARRRRWSVARASRASRASTACSKWTRHPSAKHRVPAPPPTSASGTPSASCLPKRWRPRPVAMPPGAFSFNTGEGRCPSCEGAGVRTIEMSFSARCEGAVRNLPRRALQPRDAGRDLARQEHWRCAADGGGRGRGLLCQHAQHRSPAAAFAGRGPGLPHAGPAVTHAFWRWRGAAHQAGHRTHQGARRGRSPGPEGTTHAVCAGRAHRGAAHGRRGQAHPRAAPPGGRRPQRDRDRTRPRRDRRSRLDIWTWGPRAVAMQAVASWRRPRPKTWWRRVPTPARALAPVLAR